MLDALHACTSTFRQLHYFNTPRAARDAPTAKYPKSSRNEPLEVGGLWACGVRQQGQIRM